MKSNSLYQIITKRNVWIYYCIHSVNSMLILKEFWNMAIHFPFSARHHRLVKWFANIGYEKGLTIKFLIFQLADRPNFPF